jgi:Ca2+-binding EF-hand superfamily protein
MISSQLNCIAPLQLTADKARQLKNIFSDLDYDGSGSVGIDEFRDAIAYVNAMQAQSGIPSSFGSSREINKLFKAMDSDGNGEVDFGEFMDAMTGKLSKGMVGTDRDLHALNTAFFEFARENRRRNLVESIADKNVSDSVKGSNFVQLLSMDYMPAEMDDRKNTMDLKQLKKLLVLEQKELGSKFWNARHREAIRSRQADMYFEMEKETRLRKAASLDVFLPIQTTSSTDPNDLLALPHNRDKYLRRTARMRRSDGSTFIPMCGEVDSGKGDARRHQMAIHAAKQVAM